MCDICRQFVCPGGCPNAPEAVAVFVCSGCDRDIYEGVQSATLESVKATQQKWVKDRPYHYAILGDIKALDMKKLQSLGEVTILTQEEIFGY